MITRELLDEEKDQKLLLVGTVVSALGLVFLGSAAGYYFHDVSDSSIDRSTAGDVISTALSQSSGAEVSVVDVEEQSGLYKVQLNSNSQLRTVYVTRDGHYYTSTLNNLTSFRRTVSLQADTQSCLASRNATLYGNLSQRATQLQIQVMGGTQQVAPYYQDVNQQGVLQRAAQSGVRRVPSFVVGGQALSGVNNLSSVRSFAGCGQ